MWGCASMFPNMKKHRMHTPIVYNRAIVYNPNFKLPPAISHNPGCFTAPRS